MSPLPLAATQAADPVVMVQARDGLATAALISQLALTTVFVLILLALVVLLFQLRGIQKTVAAVLGRLEKRLDPVIDRGRDVAANVEFITAAVRTDVQRVSDSVRSLSDRLQRASQQMERRVEEFNALMEVVQSEAEDILIGSAATLRGVRAGARALGGGGEDGDEPLDEDDVELADEAGLTPRSLEPASAENAEPGAGGRRAGGA